MSDHKHSQMQSVSGSILNKQGYAYLILSYLTIQFDLFQKHSGTPDWPWLNGFHEKE